MSDTFTSDSIPNRFDFTEAQARLFTFWEQGGYFNAEPNPSREPYCIVIPPPNVTGALHLGHALNNTLQDIMIRMKRMQGFETLWMPGTDHAGIATQAVVEKRLREDEGKTRHDLGRENLVARIWAWKDEYEARILGQLKRMGCSCDWRRIRFTLDPICARAVRHTFFDLFRKGLIYRGTRLVNWDTFLQTAVSDDEVFHETVRGHFWHIRYPVIDPRRGEPDHVVIATTRPETLLGDTAVAVHPNPRQALASAEQELLMKLATAPAKDKESIQAQIDDVRQRRLAMVAELETLRNMARDGRKLRLPLLYREIPLIADEWAKPEMGSGCVKITPAHDPNDYEVWQRHRAIGAINILNPDGTLNANAGPYRGLPILEARRRVVSDLDAQGLLVQVEDREIDLAHSDRSNTPIEPYLADQWFVKMDQLAQSAMDAVLDGSLKIIPSRYAKGYLDWLGEKRDWPVSRQLWWGHRIPIWYASCPEAVLKRAFGGRQDMAWVAAGGPNKWQICALEDLPPDALDRAAAAEHASLDEPLRQDPDVLDTWFSSALWPHSTLGWPERTPELAYFYPTSVLITSRDIITLWVARMVLTGLNNMGDVPFREVFIHPKILDGYGETMSKMKGNGVDPIDVIEKFGPDALRYGLAYLCTETQDVRMPVQFECPHCNSLLEQTKENRQLPRVACHKCAKPFATQWARTDADRALPRGPVVSERFEQARNFVNKLWNASRFALLNLNEYKAGPVDDSQLAVEDRWILSRLATVTTQVTEALEAYRFADAARGLYDFAWDEFCSFYLEMLKRRLQDPGQRVVAQRMLAHTLDGLLRLLHPLVPFITEEVWQLLNRVAPARGLTIAEGASVIPTAAPSIMIAPGPRPDRGRQDATIEARLATFQAVLGAVREIRTRQNIPSRIPVRFSVRADAATCELLKPMQPYFESMAHAEPVLWGPDVTPPATHAAVTVRGIEVIVDLSGLLDVGAEVRRLEQQDKKLLGQIEAKEKKLANASFLERAPSDIVQKERDSLSELKDQLATVRTALTELRRQATTTR